MLSIHFIIFCVCVWEKNAISVWIFIVNNGFEKPWESEFEFSGNYSFLNKVFLDRILVEVLLNRYRIIKTTLWIMCVCIVIAGWEV